MGLLSGPICLPVNIWGEGDMQKMSCTQLTRRDLCFSCTDISSPYGQGNYLAMSKSLLETLKLSSTCAQIENAKEAIVNHTALSC